MADSCIAIYLPAGLRKIKISDLEYVNIVGRYLTYHMTDETLRSCAMRKKFRKQVNPALISTEPLFFVEPALIVNLDLIKEIIDSENKIIFEDGQCYYVSKVQRKKIEDKLSEG